MNHVHARFAPIPTGPLHISGVRMALYNYLFVRKHGGLGSIMTKGLIREVPMPSIARANVPGIISAMATNWWGWGMPTLPLTCFKVS